MKFQKRFVPLLLALVLALGTPPVQAAALTRGEAAQALLSAAQDYNPGVQRSDILKGYPDGSLALDGTLTRAQALVMLTRAFGGFAAPAGDNARMALPTGSLTNVPAWAAEELSPVLAAGLADGDENEAMSAEALSTLLRRAYAAKGTNLKDDYYAAVNKSWLDGSDIPAGLSINGPFYGLSLTVNEQIAALIREIDAHEQTPGTAEAKIKALYDCVMDAEGRERASVAPIQKYLDAIESAKTLDELVSVDAQMQKELGLSMLLGFGLTTDLADSSRRIAAFSLIGAGMDKDFYVNGADAQRSAYTTYLTSLLTLSGLGADEAAQRVAAFYDAEAAISAASLDPQDYSNVDKTYNLFTLGELKVLLPNVNLNAVLAASGIENAERIMVSDVGALKAAAALYDDAHLALLKTAARLALLQSVATSLNQGFMDAYFDFVLAYYGVDARQSNEQIAAQQVQALLADYLSRAYVDEYFSAKAKADVEEMIGEFIAIYKERILAQDWMSAETKAKAVKKLDTMGVKVGYPDSWESCLDRAEIKSPAEGGSFFSNVIAIQMAMKQDVLAHQNDAPDKSEWIMTPFTVNACYNPSANDITFPAAILQSPLYDVNASREENLGGIGYIIAHEITHAFDNNGAKFDENGSAADWWTAEDYAAFRQKCQAVAEWYDGQEAYPGIACSGALTISENVADLGAAKCIVAAAKKLDHPDLDKLFRAVANTWASTTSRQMREYLAATDVHAPDKLRCNRVLQTLPEFYTTYGIQPGDGMWTAPETRVSVW